MLMEPTTLVRGLLKLSQKPRLILPFFMELMDMLDTLTPMELTTLAKDLLTLSQRLMLPIAMLDTMDMLDILMLMVPTPTAMATLDKRNNSSSKSQLHSDIYIKPKAA